jgi:hypothetical protein
MQIRTYLYKSKKLFEAVPSGTIAPVMRGKDRKPSAKIQKDFGLKSVVATISGQKAF